MTIDILQDDVLLEIFDSYRKYVNDGMWMWKWQKLLHVCRRWRYIVLASPRRLDLQIQCDRSTPTMELLDIWPSLPISISCYSSGKDRTHGIVAALQQRSRISRIDLSCTTWEEMKQFVAAMDEPFPVLTHLYASRHATSQGTTAVLPDSFLGGSAPRLESLDLRYTAFPALTNLVLSASHFSNLHLLSIPSAGYIPPETMVTFLLPLCNLKVLEIEFISPESPPLQITPPPSTLALLPSLTSFRFVGDGEYLADFIARIDTPMLDTLHITTHFSDPIPNIPQFHEFIDRADRIKTFTQAEVHLDTEELEVIFKVPSNRGLGISCWTSDPPLVAMMRLFEKLLSIPSQVERLELHEFEIEQEWQDGTENSDWLRLLHPFVSVKSLYVDAGLAPFIVSALEELTEERVTEVLPSLENLVIEDLESDASDDSEFVEETIRSFISMRQLSGHPVILRRWDLEQE